MKTNHRNPVLTTPVARATATEIARQPIPQELAYCANGVHELNDQLAKLTERLESILGCGSPVEGQACAGEPPTPSGMHGELVQLRTGICTAVERVKSLQDRLLI